MKAEHQKELETNVLAKALNSAVDKAKTGQLVNVRLVLIVVVLFVALGTWWYLRSSARRSDSQTWGSLENLTTIDQLEKFSSDNPNSYHGRVAKLQLARLLLGVKGLQQLSNFEKRKEAVESVEKSRDLFAKLIVEFKGDLTLQAQAIEGAAKAELALVGIPKDGSTDDRGSVDAAVKLFREFATLVGEKTVLGEQSSKKAAKLEENKQEVLQLGKELNNKYTFAAPPEPKLPPSLSPITPETKPIIEPKAPTAPVTIAPTPTSPAAPVPVPTKK